MYSNPSKTKALNTTRSKNSLAKPIFETQPCIFFLQSCKGLKGGGGTDIQGFKQFMFNIAYQTFNFESNIAFLHLSPICWFSKMMKLTHKCNNRACFIINT